MTSAGRFVIGLLAVLSACSARYDSISPEQFSEILSQCQDPKLPLDDPVLAALLSNKEAFSDPEFDAKAAREFAESIRIEWNASLDQLQVCLSRLPPADRTCETLRDCQVAFVEEKL